jgi:hypothetical protein
MSDITDRLRNPPFGTETSERNLMTAAADEIDRLRAALQDIGNMQPGMDGIWYFAVNTARGALKQ